MNGAARLLKSLRVVFRPLIRLRYPGIEAMKTKRLTPR
jgi:hypothetical protein